jgi:hypothetical protein
MKVRVLSPIGYDGRHEIGEVIEMEQSMVEAFGTDYVQVVEEETQKNDADDSLVLPEEEIEALKKELQKNNKETLRAMLQEKEIVFDENATKEELVNLLTNK